MRRLYGFCGDKVMETRTTKEKDLTRRRPLRTQVREWSQAGRDRWDRYNGEKWGRGVICVRVSEGLGKGTE